MVFFTLGVKHVFAILISVQSFALEFNWYEATDWIEIYCLFVEDG